MNIRSSIYRVDLARIARTSGIAVDFNRRGLGADYLAYVARRAKRPITK